MQVHYACIAFFCARIAPVPLQPYSQNYEYGNKKKQKSARGTKAECSVRLGSEFITREDINANYPICKMAQDVIKALKLGGDNSLNFGSRHK